MRVGYGISMVCHFYRLISFISSITSEIIFKSIKKFVFFSRFNICRDSVRETIEICNLLIEKELNPAMEQPNEDFVQMAKVLIKGLWAMNPFLQYDVFLCYLYMILANKSYNNLENDVVKPLSPKAKTKLNFIVFVIGALRFTIVRIFYMYLQIFTVWLMKKFPFLAYYRFGKEHSHVTI